MILIKQVGFLDLSVFYRRKWKQKVSDISVYNHKWFFSAGPVRLNIKNRPNLKARSRPNQIPFNRLIIDSL